ncbi:MAG: hypothetical protein G01um101420_826 [Parcubacteria group bacterium Gr01-1014_20]|nr:MAG: hypothetical protein G01um101420_826 [Parcubacteria group bacterium Gr01-1014_20]
MLEDISVVKEIPHLIGFIMPIVAIGFSVLFFVVAIVLSYHWRRYGVSKPRAAILMAIYLIGGIVLLGVIAFSVFTYQT